MAGAKWMDLTCFECLASVPINANECECRLTPPVPVSAYASAYPIVRHTNPACMRFCRLATMPDPETQPKRKPRAKKAAPKKAKEAKNAVHKDE